MFPVASSRHLVAGHSFVPLLPVSARGLMTGEMGFPSCNRSASARVIVDLDQAAFESLRHRAPPHARGSLSTRGGASFPSRVCRAPGHGSLRDGAQADRKWANRSERYPHSLRVLSLATYSTFPLAKVTTKGLTANEIARLLLAERGEDPDEY